MVSGDTRNRKINRFGNRYFLSLVSVLLPERLSAVMADLLLRCSVSSMLLCNRRESLQRFVPIQFYLNTRPESFKAVRPAFCPIGRSKDLLLYGSSECYEINMSNYSHVLYCKSRRKYL